jgi:hypothetical protein
LLQPKWKKHILISVVGRAKTIKRCKELTPKNEAKKIKSDGLYSVGQYKETYNFVIAILEILRILLYLAFWVHQYYYCQLYRKCIANIIS